MLTILFAVGSSAVAELITWINGKLTGTLLKGNGAFLVAFVMAFAAAIVKEATTVGLTFTDWHSLGTTFTEMFTLSQVYFKFVVEKFNLDIKESDLPPATF